jgi:hypothetical protein
VVPVFTINTGSTFAGVPRRDEPGKRGARACYKGRVTPTAVATCENHPQREAIGVCVTCRTRVCSECSTKVGGINYCVRCLSGLAEQQGSASARAAGGGAVPACTAYLVALGYVALLALAMWGLLAAVLPGR